MLKGYRLLIFAACIGLASVTFTLGVIITTLDANEKRYQTYRFASDKPIEIDAPGSPQTDIQALEYRSPCEDAKGQAESDLCAQWRAARAAEDSALWAWWGLLVGATGSALLILQIIQTRKAVSETAKATKAMERQNDFASQTQRAWLSIEDVKIENLWSNYHGTSGYSICIGGSYKIKNSGSAPALDVDWFEFGWDGETARKNPEVAEFISTYIKGDSEGRTCIAPGATKECEFGFAVTVSAPHGHAFVFMLCGLRYRSGEIGSDPSYTIQGYEVFRRQAEGNSTPSTIRLDEIKWDGTPREVPFTPMIRASGRFEMT